MPYFPPKQPEFNSLSHLQILTYNNKGIADFEKLKYYVAHINDKGKPDDWFFDSFLIIAGRAASGNHLYYDINMGTTRTGGGDFFAVPSPNPATVIDWSDYLDSLFTDNGVLKTLDATVAALSTKMKSKPGFKRNVVISIPYPSHVQCNFGKVKNSKHPLNFSVIGQNLDKACHQRLDACKWFADEVFARTKKANFKEINLLGLYWIYESLHYSWDVDDHWVIKELYKYIKSKESCLFWIPFYSTFNANIMSTSPGFYFDCAFLQPNHMFYPWLKDIKPAADYAKARYGGIEIEYYMNIDKTVDIGKIKYQRIKNYLNGGVKYGYMTESACAYFLGENNLHLMGEGSNKKEREVYDDIFHFVKGDYEIKK